jgi:FkbM family methyltransferase
MSVLDVGCGAGDVSFLAAELVGESGEVVGVDPASKPITLARSRAAQRAVSNVSFRQSELSDLTSDEQFDAVVGRYVLMYVRDPARPCACWRRSFVGVA